MYGVVCLFVRIFGVDFCVYFLLVTMAGSKKALTSDHRKVKVSGASNPYPCGTCGNSVVGTDSSIACDVCVQ